MVRTVHTNHFYETLAQISDPKIKFSTKLIFLKMTMSKISENWLFGPKKSSCGVVPQQNKGCKHMPEYSRPKLDQITSKSNYFYYNVDENPGCSIKIAEKNAKAKLR